MNNSITLFIDYQQQWSDTLSNSIKIPADVLNNGHKNTERENILQNYF